MFRLHYHLTLENVLNPSPAITGAVLFLLFCVMSSEGRRDTFARIASVTEHC